MDLATIFGIVIAFGALLGGNVLEGGHISSLIQPTAFIIVGGGTLGGCMCFLSDEGFGQCLEKRKKLVFSW